MNTPKFLNFNANPFGTRDAGDCMTRALVAGTRYGYKTIVDLLKPKYFDGIGAEGVTLREIQDFAARTGYIHDFDYEWKKNWRVTQRDIDNLVKYGDFSMRFWLEHLTKQDAGGSNIIFLMKLKPDEAIPDGNTLRYHAVWGNVTTKEYTDLQDTLDMIVYYMFVVDPSKMCPKDDPRYFTTEAERMRAEHRKAIAAELAKMRSKKK